MVGDWSQQPLMRAADVDREYAMGLLRNASVDGQLTREEFDERLERAMHAKTLGELATLVGDLQTPAYPETQTRYPQRPQPYAQLPAPPYHRRKKRRGVVAFVATAAALLAVGVALDNADEAPVPDVGSEVVVPQRELSGLAPTSAYDRNLAALGLPATLPIPMGADFDGGTRLSASNDGAKTTYRWHLEYKVYTSEGPVDVAQFYRENVHAQQFGASVDEQQPSGATTELRWTEALDRQGPADHTLQVRTTDLENAVRVELDVTTAVTPMRMVPDVPGELALQLRKQNRVTAGTMAYESSSIAQPVGGGPTCLVQQEWSATPSDYYALEAKFREIGASVTEFDDRWYVRFSETRTDCEALVF